MKIFKYQLAIKDSQEILMPLGARPLSVHLQHGKVCLWALVDEARKTEVREILIIGTGNPIYQDLNTADFVGTVVTEGGAIVWHVFIDREPV